MVGDNSSSGNSGKLGKPGKKPLSQAYVINEKGEEVPITDDMVEKSMREIKLQSIGAHTGYHKVVTDDMLANNKQR